MAGLLETVTNQEPTVPPIVGIPTPPPEIQPAPQYKASATDINNVYLSAFGRPAEQGGIDFWGAQNYADQDALRASIYGAAVGYDRVAIADNAMNTVGKDGTSANVGFYQNNYDADSVKGITGSDTRIPSLNTVSQWDNSIDVNSGDMYYDPDANTWKTTKPPIPNTSTAYAVQSTPVIRTVNAAEETIEGRIKNLLDENNPVIRQAGDRAMAQFAQRGLLNSSMAIQAANEAMVAKAIEIAGPDAKTYFDQGRANQDAGNQFNFAQFETGLKTAAEKELIAYRSQFDMQLKSLELDQNEAYKLRENYLADQGRAQTELNNQITNIQIQDMAANQKQAAIGEAYRMYDTRVALMNDTYLNMPTFQQEWLTRPASLYDQYASQNVTEDA